MNDTRRGSAKKTVGVALALLGLALASAPAGGASQVDTAGSAVIGQPAGAGPAAATAPRQSPGAPGRDGIVVAVRGERVYVDLGRDDSLVVGQRLRAVRPGAPLVHPVTGETLGAVDEEIAQLEVTAVAEKFATTRVLWIAGGATIGPKDRVVREDTGQAARGGAESGPAARVPVVQAAATGLALDSSRSIVSQELGYEIRDLAVADLDGDGRPELVTLDQSHLAIHHWTGTSLEVLFAEEKRRRRNYLSVDAADLDGDGRAELLVNDAFKDRGQAFIFRYDGQRLVRYDLPGGRDFRIIGAEVGAPTLAGQQRDGGGLRVEMGHVGNIYRFDPTGTGRIAARSRSAESEAAGDVYRYEWRGGQARRGEVLWTPAGTSIFVIQLYRAEGGRLELAALSPTGHLRLFRGHEEVWSSPQALDGTTRIVPLDGVRGRSGEPVPAFVLRHDERGSAAATDAGSLTGAVLALAVDGPGARELWRTAPFEGHVAAYRAADLGPVSSGAGGRALVIALDLEKGLSRAARSVVVVQPLR